MRQFEDQPLIAAVLNQAHWFFTTLTATCRFWRQAEGPVHHVTKFFAAIASTAFDLSVIVLILIGSW